jgi:cell shape-determining protein MreC
MFQTPSLLLTLLLLGVFALLLALALLRVRKLGEHSRQFAALATRQRQGLDTALRQYVEAVEARNGELAAELAKEREKAHSINARMVAAQNKSAARHRQPADSPHYPQGKP